MHGTSGHVSGLIVPGEERPIAEPEPGLRRQILVYSQAMMLVRHEMKKGWEGTAHSHPHEQMVYVISGSIRISVNGASLVASAGDNFVVASNAEHQATALEDAVVLDIFTPCERTIFRPDSR
jgi:quercetin dioxygenase-like cupin family protein